MLSQTAEYALRAVVCLAAHPATPLTTERIAAVGHVPRGYLTKIMSLLVRAGLVVSQRGRRGGFVLGRPAAAITMLDVISACAALPRQVRCPHQDDGDLRLCALCRRLRQALQLSERLYARTTLARLTRGAPGRQARQHAHPASANGRHPGHDLADADRAALLAGPGEAAPATSMPA